MAKLEARKAALNTDLLAASSDHARLTALGEELATVEAELAGVEEAWLELSEERDGS